MGGDRGGGVKIFVMADPGGTHGGDLDRMFQLIEAAKVCGADCIKLQWTSSPEWLAERRRAEEYVDAYRAIAFPREWLNNVAFKCRLVGIELAVTCYLPEDIHVVAPYVRRFKIASFEARDHYFRLCHREFRKPLIVSTGGLAAEEVGAIRASRDWLGGDSLLYCISAYPAPAEEMNLGAMIGNYGLGYAGLSDHSMSPVVAAMAVARGAEIIEAHLRLDNCDPTNADYPHSMPPVRFSEYVATIRLAERIMGEGPKRVMPSEEPWAKYAVRP